MKKIVIAIAGLVLSVAVSAGVYFNHVEASSYDEIRIERVANYNGALTSKVRYEKNYAVICEPVASGSIDVGVSNIEYSKSGAKATVYLYDKNEAANHDNESHYVTYWNIYVPMNDTVQSINVKWN